jgi:hypothetical protein
VFFFDGFTSGLRECPTPDSLQQCETPDKAADYWRLHIATHPHFNPDCECLAVLLLNTRRKVKGHQIVSIGTMDTILVHSREVFRLAIVTAASALIVMHNHPSGEPQPRASTKTSTACAKGQFEHSIDIPTERPLFTFSTLWSVIVSSPNFQSRKSPTLRGNCALCLRTKKQSGSPGAVAMIFPTSLQATTLIRIILLYITC